MVTIELVWWVGRGTTRVTLSRVPCIGECIQTPPPGSKLAKVVSVLHGGGGLGTVASVAVEQYEPKVPAAEPHSLEAP